MDKNHPIHHQTIIRIEKLHKKFFTGKRLFTALRDIDLEIKATDFVVIYGPSGCGKTTLLNIIAGIDQPTAGEVEIRDTEIFELSDDQRGIFRSKKMGYIHQFPLWIRSLNTIENIAFPLLIEGEAEDYALSCAQNTMEELKITDLAKLKPTSLSGGEQQRASLARAIVTNPWIILADEPTGNLDSHASDTLMKYLKQLNKRHKRTIILVTHNQSYWPLGTRRIEMKDGLIVKDTSTG